MKNFNITNLYSFLGKVLTGTAGGIIGLVTSGPLLAIPLIIAGVLLGTLLEKSIQKPLAE